MARLANSGQCSPYILTCCTPAFTYAGTGLVWTAAKLSSEKGDAEGRLVSGRQGNKLAYPIKGFGDESSFFYARVSCLECVGLPM